MPGWFKALAIGVLAVLTATAIGAIGVLARLDPADLSGLLKGPQFLSAAIAALVALILLVGNRFADMGHAEHERQTREVKAMIGLAAEIRSNLERQRRSFARAERERALAELVAGAQAAPTAIRDAEKGSGGKIGVQDSDNFVYQSLKTEVLMLPTEVIGPLIAYYNLDGMQNDVIKRSSVLGDIEPLRRVKYFVELFELADATDAAGLAALVAIWHRLPDHRRRHVETAMPLRGTVLPLDRRLVGLPWERFPTGALEREAAALVASPASGPSTGIGSEERNDGSDHDDPPSPAGTARSAAGHAP